MRILLRALTTTFVLGGILLNQPASAAPVIDVNVFYWTDSFSYGDTDNSYARTFYDFMLGLSLTKKRRLLLGWNYGSMSFTDSPNSEETALSVTDMGPKLVYYLNKNRTVVAAFTYNLITRADYTPPAGDTTELRGTSMKFELGWLPQVSDSIFFGVKINYYSASFNEEITNETALEQVSYTRAIIYPSLSLTFRWD